MYEQLLKIAQIRLGKPHPSFLKGKALKYRKSSPCLPLCGHSAPPPTVWDSGNTEWADKTLSCRGLGQNPKRLFLRRFPYLLIDFISKDFRSSANLSIYCEAINEAGSPETSGFWQGLGRSPKRPLYPIFLSPHAVQLPQDAQPPSRSSCAMRSSCCRLLASVSCATASIRRMRFS